MKHAPTDRSARNHPSEITARLLTWAYALATLVNLALLVAKPARAGATWVEMVFGELNVPVERSLITTVTTALTFWCLLRRKRVGLWAAMFFQVTGVLFGIEVILTRPIWQDVDAVWTESVLGRPVLDVIGGLVGLAALVLLFLSRDCFPAKVARASYGPTLVVLGIAVVAVLLLAWAINPSDSLADVGATLVRALGIQTPAVEATLPRVHGWQIQAVSTAMGLGAIAVVFTFLRSAPAPHSWTGESALHLRELLHEHGGQDSLSYFATRRDKSVIYSPDGRAAISYRVIGSVSLASGDPVGAEDAWPAAIAAWREEARTYAWIPGVISASRAGARAYVRSGMAVTTMGDEAILYPDRFTLDSTSMTELRQTVNRLTRSGMYLRIRRHGELSEAALADVVRLTDSWRHGGTERGFSMALNRLGDPADTRCLLVTAHTADGEPVGLLSFVPWGSHGISLDVMRRAPGSPNGTTEFMIAELMAQAEDFGITRVSLNFAMFRQTFARSQELGASLWTRVNSSVLGVLDRFLQLERLYRFNDKFNPVWVPRFLCWESRVSLANVAFAAGIAEGFLPEWLAARQPQGNRLDADQLERLHRIEQRRVVAAEDLAPRFSDQTRHRIAHLEQMRAAGYDPYPKGTGEGTDVDALAALLASGTAVGQEAAVNGRVRSVRRHGGVVFVDLIRHGTTVQCVLDESVAGADTRRRARWIDVGDYLLLRGRIGTSRNGTPSLLVESWTTTAKSLHPIPFESFTDPEARLRRRSMDLIIHPEESARLRVRSATIRAIRRTLDQDGFLEVETPMLNTVHGGASARPFKTFINAYGVDLTLRIAPELYLKRLVVGDMGPVYELGRDFRNEGADATHNPEFTVLEAYQPYADYTTMQRLTEKLLKNAAAEVFGTVSLPLRGGEHPKDPRGQAVLTDVSGPWPVVPMLEALSAAVGEPISLDTDMERLLELAREHEIHVADEMGPGAIIEELYGELVEARTSRPTFYTDFPVETSPLAGPHRSVPGLAERWDLVINGTEMGTAYSEMADALEQRRRLTEQSLKAAAGDLEAMQVDEDFLDALETGMPPTGGLGIGIDRLIMMLTEAPIRGVLAFPFVRPMTGTRPGTRRATGPDSAATE